MRSLPGSCAGTAASESRRFLEDLYQDAKARAPESLFTYVNYPPTEFLDLSFFDVCAFNVYLHGEADLRAYLARLQHVAGGKPLLLAEAGADSLREGDVGQASIASMQVRAAFEEGAAGAIVFAWTDEWWRGGEAVEDWSFGLVDRERRPKAAAAAVGHAFRDAPFATSLRTTWPRVSVVVCAYNAATTLEECLNSLERLAYPDFEIVLVNDGSHDSTGAIARRHPRVRVIDTPNRGLGAARNAGLAAGGGEIVAYVDADVRVEQDWLDYLVQPLLGSADVVGSGGPNIVPADDPPLAQCIACAPGGPTHVLLEDRVAEHVPGCNMAFRKTALLEIGGFNPIFLRAGDDVDVCWRLQARGWKIGFSPSALVWHHYRASVRAYWRQQVGYGEGETWLMEQHPEKFLDGRMLWRGRMYSPLPFVRSLWGTRVNAGVWGTAAFPSVYRTDAHLLALLPHSLTWQAFSLVFLLSGILAWLLGSTPWAVASLIAAGLAGVTLTLARNVSWAFRSNVDSLPRPRSLYRGIIAWLHLVQPIARAWGRLRGTLTPPEVAQPRPRAHAERGPKPSMADTLRAALLLSGSVVEDRFWSERWTSVERVLTSVTERMRRFRPARTVAVDEGWSPERDLSVLVGRWAWLDLRALVEEHERGRCLLRVGTTLRPTAFGVAVGLGVGTALAGALAAGVVNAWPLASAGATLATLSIGLCSAMRVAYASALAREGTRQVAASHGMVPHPPDRARPPLPAPSRTRVYGLRVASLAVLTMLWLGASAFLRRDPAVAEMVGAGARALGGGRLAISVWLDSPGGIAVGPEGDIYVADSDDALVRRVDSPTLLITPFAGIRTWGVASRGTVARRRWLDSTGHRAWPSPRTGRSSSPTRTTTASAV